MNIPYILDPPEISFIIPCLNERDNVEAIARAVAVEVEKLALSYEIIFIDNASNDGTPDIIKRMCARDSRIRLIVNNRNFGQMRSPTYAIYQATATGAVIGICADFQDPPELIGPIIQQWRAGSKIVLAVKRSEAASSFIRLLRAGGYAFLERFGDYQVIRGATGFGLYDRQVVNCLKTWRDPDPFFRGMLVESGYNLSTIYYDKPKRAPGESKNNLWTLISFFISSVASSAKNLLRAPLYLAIFSGALSVVMIFMALFLFAVGRLPWWLIGWAVGVAAFAVVMMFMGIMGEQIRQISEMCRNTPLVIERERVNFPERS